MNQTFPPQVKQVGPHPGKQTGRKWTNVALWGAALASFAVVSALILGLWLQRAAWADPSSTAAGGDGTDLPRLWDAPELSAIDQRGRPFTSATLRGRPWILDFVFTRCTTACPTLSARLALLRRQLRGPDVRFVSLSVDPEHDRPEVLAQYAAQWGADDERWLLLSSDTATASYVATQMHVTLQRSDDATDPIIHSSYFFLVDADGQVRGAYDSLDDAAMRRLVEDASRLGAGTAERASSHSGEASDGASGAALFTALGCAAFHDHTQLAPPLAGLENRTVQLMGGATVVADAAFVRESILSPAAKVAPGYGTVMPSYAGQLSDAQLERLVEHVLSFQVAPGEGAPAAPEAGPEVIDVVCGMTVATRKDTPRAEHGGKTYYFCGEPCQERFVASPEKYVPR